jgi:hypothetical protein
MKSRIDEIVTELGELIVLIETNAKGGKTPISYFGIKPQDIELVSELADERGKHDAYQLLVARAINVSFKTAQTVQTETGRSDTLTEKQKKAKALEHIAKLFTAKESDATKTKRQLTNVKEVMIQLRAAQQAGDTDESARLNDLMLEMMGVE